MKRAVLTKTVYDLDGTEYEEGATVYLLETTDYYPRIVGSAMCDLSPWEYVLCEEDI